MKRDNNKKTSKLPTIILCIILLAGVCIMAYPTVSDLWNARHATRSIASYIEQVDNTSQAMKEELLQEADDYNRTLDLGVHFKLDEEAYARYESVLDITGTGIMGYVQIPSIHVNLPVYHGTDEAVLQIAAGHIAGSSLPTGGAGTHAVISGHRGLPSARLFTDLDRLVEGDIFMVTVLDRVCTYQIDQIHIVFPEEIADLAIEEGKDYMTLVTCTPYGINTHRMLIRGHRIGTPESGGSVIVTAEAVRVAPVIVFFGIAVPLLFVTAAVSLAVSNARGRKKSHEQILQEMEQAVALGGEKDEKNHEDNS
ncbi:MAG: class C sortase [Lachnospiraceae bacterium]|jgi:sortase A